MGLDEPNNSWSGVTRRQLAILFLYDQIHPRSPDLNLRPKVIVVIPARGGSKGIPLKNLTKIGDKSLLARSIEVGFEVGQRVFVSTDSQEVANEAIRHQAKVVARPEKISQDDSISEDAIVHALSSENIASGICVFLQATSPFTEAKDVRRGVEAVLSGEADCAFGAVLGNYHLWSEDLHGTWGPKGHSIDVRLPRQREPRRVLESGAFYVFRVENFLASKSRFHQTVLPIFQSVENLIDIDSLEDLELASKILG